MPRLYPMEPVPAIDAPEGTFTPADDGGFDLPDITFDLLHSSHHGGRKFWETQIERDTRALAAERAHREDPGTLLDVVTKLLELQTAQAASQAGKTAPAAKTAPKAATPGK